MEVEGGGGGRGRPTMEPILRGRVLDLVRLLGMGRSWRVLVMTGESGADPLRRFFLGGATGVTVSVPLGGKGGLTVCCVVGMMAAAAVLDKAFLTCVVRRG